MTWFLTAVRHEVNNLESSVVVQELEFAINRALYGVLWSLGNQYIVGSLSWRSLDQTVFKFIHRRHINVLKWWKIKAARQSIDDICHLQNVLGVNLFRDISGVYYFWNEAVGVSFLRHWNFKHLPYFENFRYLMFYKFCFLIQGWLWLYLIYLTDKECKTRAWSLQFFKCP